MLHDSEHFWPDRWPSRKWEGKRILLSLLGKEADQFLRAVRVGLMLADNVATVRRNTVNSSS